MNDLSSNTNVYNRIISLYHKGTDDSDLAMVATIWLPMNRSLEKASSRNKINYLMDAKKRIFYLDTNTAVAV